MGLVASISIIGLGPAGEGTSNTFAYKTDDVGTNNVEALQACLAAFLALIADDYRACIAPQWTWFKSFIHSYIPEFPGHASTGAEDFGLEGAVGTAGAAATSMERCVIIQKISGDLLRSGRGRIYVPMPRGDIAGIDGYLDPTHTTAHETLAADMLEPLTDGLGKHWAPCILHVPTSFGTAYSLTALNPVIGIQRRRRARPGGS